MKAWNSTLNQTSKKQTARNKKLSKIPYPEDGCCEKCKKWPDFRGLHKHHIKFRTQGGSDERYNLAWVCGSCSNKAHNIKEVINGSSRVVFTRSDKVQERPHIMDIKKLAVF